MSREWLERAQSRQRTATSTAKRYSVWQPETPTEKQAEFLALECLEAFYGGAAGGGKSSAQLMAFLKYVHVPGYAGLILRRTYADLSLPGALMDRAQAWFANTPARWNGRDHQWQFPCQAGGHSLLQFGYLETENDKYRYQSSEFQFIGLDEMPQFSPTQATYMFSRLRKRDGFPVPLRFRGSGNPGGVSHEYVRARYIDSETRVPGVVFVPAKLADNPHVDQASYRESLGRLDPVTRRQLEDGDWDATKPGDYFNRESFTLVDIATPHIQRRVRFWDMAASAEPGPKGGDPDYTASCHLGIDQAGAFWVLDTTMDRWPVAELEKNVVMQADADGRLTQICMEQEPGSSGEIAVNAFRRALSGYAFEGVKSTGSKVERAKPAAAAVSDRRVFVVRGPRTKAFLDHMHQFPHGAHDDLADAFSGALNKLAGAVTGGRIYTPGNMAADRGAPLTDWGRPKRGGPFR